MRDCTPLFFTQIMDMRRKLYNSSSCS